MADQEKPIPTQAPRESRSVLPQGLADLALTLLQRWMPRRTPQPSGVSGGPLRFERYRVAPRVGNAFLRRRMLIGPPPTLR